MATQASGVRPSGVRPAELRLAAAAQALEAVGLAVAGVFAAIATADGQSYTKGSGIALTLICFGVAAGLAAFAVGLNRARPWTRTPVVMTQLFVILGGVYLVIGHRLAWGVPALVIAALCLAGIFTPASLRALNRFPLDPPPATKPAATAPATRPPAKNQPRPAKNQAVSTKNRAASAKGQARPAKNQPAKNQPAKNQPAKKGAR
jgi:hypothetical protein